MTYGQINQHPPLSGMMSIVSPAFASGACGLRTIRQSARAIKDSMELSCGANGVATPSSVI